MRCCDNAICRGWDCPHIRHICYMFERLNVLKCINAEFFGEFRTVFKNFIHHLTILFSCIVGLFIIACVQLPSAYAAGVAALPGAAPQVTISLPGGGPPVGHPGTKVHIAGTGFTPSTTAALYTTPTNDPAKCIVGADPAALGLKSFATKPTVDVQADGTFQVDTTWPNNAATATTPYYVCATAGASGSLGGLSATSFTVAQPVALQVTPQSPTTISPGSQVTISGTNWLPPQALTVAIVPPGAAGVVVSDHATPDANGNFSIMLTVPSTTAAGTYSVSVIADGEPTMKATLANAVTVSASPTPTATATAAPSPTATTAPTPTATTTPSAPPPTSGGGGGMTILIFALGGIGAVLIIVGIVLFAAYSRATT